VAHPGAALAPEPGPHLKRQVPTVKVTSDRVRAAGVVSAGTAVWARGCPLAPPAAERPLAGGPAEVHRPAQTGATLPDGCDKPVRPCLGAGGPSPACSKIPVAHSYAHPRRLVPRMSSPRPMRQATPVSPAPIQGGPDGRLVGRMCAGGPCQFWGCALSSAAPAVMLPPDQVYWDEGGNCTSTDFNILHHFYFVVCTSGFCGWLVDIRGPCGRSSRQTKQKLGPPRIHG
jgi:hypothetical protein